MFIAEFKRRYEKELEKLRRGEETSLKTPLTVSRLTAPYSQNPNHWRTRILNTSQYKDVQISPGKYNKINNLTQTINHHNLRSLLGGTATTNNLNPNNLSKRRQEITDVKARLRKIAGLDINIPPKAYKKHVNSYISTTDRDKFKSISSTIATSSFQPIQPQALPPSVNNTTVTSTQVSSRNIGHVSNSAQNMPPLKRTTSAPKIPHTPIKAGGMNKMLLGGVAAGAGLLGVGAYGLYRQNRDKNKR
jgi:hypothetical protein